MSLSMLASCIQKAYVPPTIVTVLSVCWFLVISLISSYWMMLVSWYYLKGQEDECCIALYTALASFTSSTRTALTWANTFFFFLKSSQAFISRLSKSYWKSKWCCWIPPCCVNTYNQVVQLELFFIGCIDYSYILSLKCLGIKVAILLCCDAFTLCFADDTENSACTFCK